MAIMLKAHAHRTCPYGRKCCDYDFAKPSTLRRRQRAREKVQWKRLTQASQFR